MFFLAIWKWRKMVWFWYLGISYQVYVIDKNHTDVHLNFCFYFEVFPKHICRNFKLQGYCTNNSFQITSGNSANKQECLQINKTTQCFGTVNLKGKERSFYLETGLQGTSILKSPLALPYLKWETFDDVPIMWMLWHKQMYIYI